MWNSLSNCGEFKITRNSFKGSSSIKLSWDKTKDCEWLVSVIALIIGNPLILIELLIRKQ